MKFKIIILLLGIVLVSGCGDLDEGGDIKENLEDLAHYLPEDDSVTGIKKFDCNSDYMINKNGTLLVNWNCDWNYIYGIKRIGTLALKDICIESLNENQIDCLVGYVSTFNKNDYYESIYFDGEGFNTDDWIKIDCDRGCRDIYLNHTLKEGVNSIKYPEYDYVLDEVCWK